MKKHKLLITLRDIVVLVLALSLLFQLQALAQVSIILLAVFLLVGSAVLFAKDNNIAIRILTAIYVVLALPPIILFSRSIDVLNVYIVIYSVALVLINLGSGLQRLIPSKGKGGKGDILKFVFCLAVAILYGIYGLSTPALAVFAGLYALAISTYSLSNGKLYSWLQFKGRRLVLNYPIIFDIGLPYLWKRELEQDATYEAPMVRSDNELAKQYPEEKVIKIQIVTGDNPIDIVGHTALSYKGTTYTYGNHDVKTRKLFSMIGKGVLVATKAADMYKFNSRLKATTFEYDVLLADEDIPVLEKHMQELLEGAYEWQPDDANHRKRYIGVVNRVTDSKLYHYDGGVYENYSLLGTNCAWIENRAMDASDIPSIGLVSVPLPGTVLLNLERTYQQEKSQIINRTIYYY